MESEKPDVVVAESSKGNEEQLESERSKIEKIEEDEAEASKDSESKLISLISQTISLFEDSVHSSDSEDSSHSNDTAESNIVPLIIEIISLVSSMDLDSQPKPISKLISLITQTVSVFNSMDIDSLPKHLSKLISFISRTISKDSDKKLESDRKFTLLVGKTLRLKPVPELISLIRQIVSIVISMDSMLNKLISLRPQVYGYFHEGKFEVLGDVKWQSDYKWDCFLGNWKTFRLRGEDATHFHCRSCHGEYHTEYEKTPVVIKHSLHQKHFLQLALDRGSRNRECYCCDEDLQEVFYYCSSCDYSMNIACVEKPQDLSINQSKWHEHTLVLFPRKTSLTCDLCSLADSSCPFYICPPCDFVVHQRCIKLPHVIKISRHRHRISFTPSFNHGDWSCGVCRRNINTDYGGYCCIKDGCLYAAHLRCATQRNIWDGINLEGEPEETEEEVVEPFVRISNGLIRHFSHTHHHLRFDDNTCRDYDENKQCQVCITPIYVGKLYSCEQCEFVLHEVCANLPHKIYHPIHPHFLTIAQVGGNDNVVGYREKCSACQMLIAAGFFYECGKEECDFRLHVKCAIISEPLLHESHGHSLFLTSKPGDWRSCHVCQGGTHESFNCIECDDFALCFNCATLPPKVRYTHDKHILTLSYGEETSTMTYWCEACERKIDPKKRFYMCDEYCCVTLHIQCLIGEGLYMKPGSSFDWYTRFHTGIKVHVLPNNHHMTRPICSKCEKRCPHKIILQCSGSIFCSETCLNDRISTMKWPI